MADPGKPIAAIAGKSVILHTRCATVDEFVERYAMRAMENGFLFENPQGFAIGREVRVQVQLQDNQPVIEASGVLREAPENAEFGTLIEFKSVEANSQGVLARMLKRKQAGQPGPGGAALLEPGLEKSLRRMVLISEDAPAPVGAASSTTGAVATGPVVGIDLGTTNSCCAVVRDGRPVVVPSRRGHNTVPSVVAVTSFGEVLVGHAARSQMEINPERTIYGSKRLVGRPFDSPIVRQVRDRFHYKIVEGPKHEAAVQVGDKVMSLEEVSAKILGEMKSIAQEFLGTLVHRAVITVPAYYNENQRLAVRRAGELAGLKVERIVNEPTAAALAYGYNRGIEQQVLIYDLGGGTFDASILNLYGNVYEVVATGGDTFLGGLDFDTQLADHILIEFQLQLGKFPEMERVAFMRVLQGAEFAKISLSNAGEANVSLPFIGTLAGKPVNLDVKVTRGLLEDLVKPLIARTLQVCDSVIRQAKLEPGAIDHILLVGAQTRMPLVWEMVRAHFGKEPLKGVHPDESVAIGAALLAESLDKLDAVVLIDVLPISIGLGVPGGIFRKVLPAGTALPASKTYGLYTFQDNQSEMHLPVYQGESQRVDDNELLGTVHLRGIPPGPAGSRMIEITFSLSPECLLTVSARDHEGVALAEVIMSTQETPASLKEQLGLVSPQLQTKKTIDLPAAATSPTVPGPPVSAPVPTPPAAKATPPASKARPPASKVPPSPPKPPAKKRGILGFLSRWFSKNS